MEDSVVKNSQETLGGPRLNPILTFRGLLLAAFLVYLLVFPVYQEADIVASVLATGFSALLLSAVIITFLGGRWLRKNLTTAELPATDPSRNILQRYSLPFYCLFHILQAWSEYAA